ncbi:glycolate oxidase subunit GlcF [Pelagibacteraceae bacterium]|nr:glycolate oxidase subunit GlcF [Pelagibacteraceae bacterium]|tara:strand:+ start:83 stop:1381 length:1299 start_codon:yes stop_codon:yes gene_type:complete
METNFSKEQLKDKDNKSSEKIFRKCVHCGFCNATCPTYKLLGDELDGPRGRIYLIKDMIENNKPANEKIVKHIDRCLSCYSCMTTCPSGVNYMHLVDHGRNHIEKTYKRPFMDRLIRSALSKILSRSINFKIVSFLVRLLKPFSFIFPKKIKKMINLMPIKFPKRTMPKMKLYSAQNKGKPIARVALLTGCVQKVLSPQINEASIRILNRHGIEVVVSKGIDCCGSLNHHLGKSDLANDTFKKNIKIWYDEYLNNGLDAIISNTSGCGTTLKDYGFIFRSDPELKKKAKKISELTKDISEYLDEKVKLNFIKNKKEYKIAYHSACSMQHGQKVHDVPISLIKKTGNKVLEIPEGHICCGSAGTYNLLQSDIASELLKNKVANIKKINPQFITTGNIGCITQIANGINIPILHTVEIIDWYTGGPKPTILNRI